jgi:hypothetical protein
LGRAIVGKSANNKSPYRDDTYKEKVSEKGKKYREIKKTELSNLLNAGSNDHSALNQWAIEIGELDKVIEDKTMRWLELSEL